VKEAFACRGCVDIVLKLWCV